MGLNDQTAASLVNEAVQRYHQQQSAPEPLQEPQQQVVKPVHHQLEAAVKSICFMKSCNIGADRDGLLHCDQTRVLHIRSQLHQAAKSQQIRGIFRLELS